jgi:hypothetical protein
MTTWTCPNCRDTIAGALRIRLHRQDCRTPVAAGHPDTNVNRAIAERRLRGKIYNP